MNDYTHTRVVICDVFGSLLDASGVPYEEKKAYVDHVKKPEWSPLELPESWATIPAFADTAEGISRLGEEYVVATLSNWPREMTARVLRHNEIYMDGIIDLARFEVYKTHPLAYCLACFHYGVAPREVLMVTANEKFGDLEAARALGMQAVLIRGDDGGPKTLIELAELLNC